MNFSISIGGFCLYMEDTNGHFYMIIQKIQKVLLKGKYLLHLLLVNQKFSSFSVILFQLIPWIISLTDISYEREIRSVGLIFTSSAKSKFFRCILSILLSNLPCQNILNTFCSYRDVGLARAFTEEKMNNNEIDENISRLKRVICYWHKIETLLIILLL